MGKVINPHGNQPILHQAPELSLTLPLYCSCGSSTFQSLSAFRRVPSVATPNGKPGIYRQEVVRCTSCGAEYDSLDSLTTEKKEKD